MKEQYEWLHNSGQKITTPVLEKPKTKMLTIDDASIAASDNTITLPPQRNAPIDAKLMQSFALSAPESDAETERLTFLLQFKSTFPTPIYSSTTRIQGKCICPSDRYHRNAIPVCLLRRFAHGYRWLRYFSEQCITYVELYPV